MKKLNKIISAICTLAIMIACLSVSAFASDDFVEQKAAFEPYTTNELPVDAMRELNIQQLPPLPIARSSTADGVFQSREYTVYEDGIVVGDTYVLHSLTRADAKLTVTKKNSYTAQNSSVGTNLEWYVTGDFYYNTTDNTAYCRNEKAEITKCTAGFTISKESLTTAQGGLITKWASATYSFTSSSGTSRNHSDTIKVDSKGQKI